MPLHKPRRLGSRVDFRPRIMERQAREQHIGALSRNRTRHALLWAVLYVPGRDRGRKKSASCSCGCRSLADGWARRRDNFAGALLLRLNFRSDIAIVRKDSHYSIFCPGSNTASRYVHPGPLP